MQVLEVQAGLLSHREVLSIIQSDMQEASEAAEAYKRRRIQQRDALKAMGKFGVGFRDAELSKLISPSNVVEIQKLTHAYLTESQLPTHKQTVDSVVDLTTELGKFPGGLTRAEKLQLVNSCPQSLPELFLIIDKIQERIPDESLHDELLEMIQSHLNSDTSDADSASALAAQQRTQESAAQERSHQLDMAEEIQHEEEEEEEEDYEEEDDEEDLLITSAAGGRAQAEDLELDEQAENAGGDS